MKKSTLVSFLLICAVATYACGPTFTSYSQNFRQFGSMSMFFNPASAGLYQTGIWTAGVQTQGNQAIATSNISLPFKHFNLQAGYTQNNDYTKLNRTATIGIAKKIAIKKMALSFGANLYGSRQNFSKGEMNFWDAIRRTDDRLYFPQHSQSLGLQLGTAIQLGHFTAMAAIKNLQLHGFVNSYLTPSLNTSIQYQHHAGALNLNHAIVYQTKGYGERQLSAFSTARYQFIEFGIGARLGEIIEPNLQVAFVNKRFKATYTYAPTNDILSDNNQLNYASTHEFSLSFGLHKKGNTGVFALN